MTIYQYSKTRFEKKKQKRKQLSIKHNNLQKIQLKDKVDVAS